MDRPLSLKRGMLSLDDLLLVAHELGTSWKMLGRALGLQPFKLDHIEEDERKLVEKCYGVYGFIHSSFGVPNFLISLTGFCLVW